MCLILLILKKQILIFVHFPRKLQKRKEKQIISPKTIRTKHALGYYLHMENGFLHQISTTLCQKSDTNQEANIGVISSILRVEKLSQKTKRKWKQMEITVVTKPGNANCSSNNLFGGTRVPCIFGTLQVELLPRLPLAPL